MKSGWAIGIGCAVAVHAGIILFGGLLIPGAKKNEGTTQPVELVSEVEAQTEKEQPLEQKIEKTEEIQAETEKPPDATEVMRNLELAAVDNGPALEAASLSAIEAALNGQGGGGGDFAEAMNFTSGGHIGSTGKGGPLGDKFDSAFSLAELDQKPRAIFQGSPSYPAEMRDKKAAGSVTVIFIVDEAGKVTEPRVEKSSHQAFEKPALDAVKQWKFEPAVKGGQRVPCKMRETLRFQTR